MQSELIIIGYTSFSLLFLILVGIFLYRYRVKKERQFSNHISKIKQGISNNDEKEIVENFRKILWNPQMTKQYYVFIINELSSSTKESEVFEPIKSELVSVFKKKGWGKYSDYV